MVILNQDLSQYTPQDFEPIPPAKYDFEVSDTDIVQTKTGKRMIKISFRVLGPTHQGRFVFENFVLDNDIALIRLKSLATAACHPRPDFIQDTQELHGLVFRGNVGIKKSEGYPDMNNVRSFEKMPAQGQQPGTQQPPPPPHPPASFPRVPPPPPLPKMTPPPAQPHLTPSAQGADKPCAPWMK